MKLDSRDLANKVWRVFVEARVTRPTDYALVLGIDAHDALFIDAAPHDLDVSNPLKPTWRGLAVICDHTAAPESIKLQRTLEVEP